MIATSLIEKLTGRAISRTAYLVIFVAAFFLCSCLLAWIDEHDRAEAFSAQAQGANLKLVTKEADCKNELSSQGNSFRNDISALRQDVAVKEAVTQTLQKQNRDQQSTINGCLSQAMKLLTPEERKITARVLHSDNEGKSEKTIEWIALINKTIEHPTIVVSCNRPLLSANLGIAGGHLSMGQERRLSQNAFAIEIVSPPWSPTYPFYAKLSYIGDIGIGCSFDLR